MSSKTSFDPENIQYLEHFLGTRDMEVWHKIQESDDDGKFDEEEQNVYQDICELLTTMSMYRSNHWWESKDNNEIAYYQLLCKYQLVSNSTFVEAVEFLLGRQVPFKEIHERKPELLQEAICAWCAGGGSRSKNPHSTK